jgi:hypothetical protein
MRSTKIPARLILSLTKYDGISSGQYRFNHTDCSAGEDTKKRLYIKIPTKQPWTRVAYCHNCGLSGFATLRSNSYDYRRAKQHEKLLHNFNATERNSREYGYKISSGDRKQERLTTDRQLQTPFEDCPSDVKVRLTHARIDEDRYNRYLINYSPAIDRIIIPYVEYSDQPSLLSTQFKAVTPGTIPKFFTEEEPGAEYKTDVISRQSMSLAHRHIRKESEEGFVHTPDTSCLTTGNKTLVIVEDYFSAINIAETNDNYHALPLAGVHYNTMQIAEILERNLYTNIIVWLDNDNETVIKKAKRLETDLEFLGGGATVHRYIGTNHDPKLLSDTEISGTIDTMITETDNDVL